MVGAAVIGEKTKTMFSEVQTIITIARQLNAKNGAKSGLPLPPLVFITDAIRQKDPARIILRLPPDSLVLIRDYHHPARATYAAEMAKACRARRLPFLVAGDALLALRLNAAGVHLPQHQARQALKHRLARPQWLITASAHSVPELHRLNALPVDAALYSPLFATASHPDAPPLGRHRFSAGVHHKPAIPVYALGGIDGRTIAQVRGLPVAGIAAIGAFAPFFKGNPPHDV